MNNFQQPPKQTLEGLVAAIKARATRRTPGGKRDLKAQSETAEQRASNLIARRIEEELKWYPVRLILLTLHQHCQCGSCYRSVIGLFLESKHSETGATRKRPPANLTALDRLPHAKEEFNESLGICPNCMLERELVDALMNPIHDACLQLPLFGHQMQQRSCS